MTKTKIENIINANFDNNEKKILENINNISEEIIKNNKINFKKLFENKILNIYLNDEKNNLETNFYLNIWKLDFFLDEEKKIKWFQISINKFDNENEIKLLNNIKNIKIQFDINENSDSIIDLLSDFFELEIWDEFSDIMKNSINWLYLISNKNNNTKIKKFNELLKIISKNLSSIKNNNNIIYEINLPIIINKNNKINNNLFISSIIWINNFIDFHSIFNDSEIIIDLIKEIIYEFKNTSKNEIILNIEIIKQKKLNEILKIINKIHE